VLHLVSPSLALPGRGGAGASGTLHPSGGLVDRAGVVGRPGERRGRAGARAAADADARPGSPGTVRRARSDGHGPTGTGSTHTRSTGTVPTGTGSTGTRSTGTVPTGAGSTGTVPTGEDCRAGSMGTGSPGHLFDGRRRRRCCGEPGNPEPGWSCGTDCPAAGSPTRSETSSRSPTRRSSSRRGVGRYGWRPRTSSPGSRSPRRRPRECAGADDGARRVRTEASGPRRRAGR
jgi:hypothetical protein